MTNTTFKNSTFAGLSTLIVRPLFTLIFLIIFIMNYNIIGDFLYAIIIIATLFILMELQGLFLILFNRAANLAEIKNEDIIFRMLFKRKKTYRVNNIMSIDIVKFHEVWHFPLKVSFNNGDIIRLELVDIKGFVKLLKELNPRINVGKKVSKITLW